MNSSHDKYHHWRQRWLITVDHGNAFNAEIWDDLRKTSIQLFTMTLSVTYVPTYQRTIHNALYTERVPCHQQQFSSSNSYLLNQNRAQNNYHTAWPRTIELSETHHRQCRKLEGPHQTTTTMKKLRRGGAPGINSFGSRRTRAWETLA